MDAKEIGRLVRDAREAKDWSQAKFARMIGVKQQSIDAIERGDTRRSKFLPEIARELGIPPEHLGLPPGASVEQRPVLPPVADQYGARDFEIYNAAEGGLGEILRSVDPVDWWPRPIEVQRVKGAYGMYIVGESMVPQFMPGQVAVVNPNLPHIANKAYIFYGETEAGTVRATIKVLRKHTGDQWHVMQHNPPPGQKGEFILPRKVWREAHRVVGWQDPS